MRTGASACVASQTDRVACPYHLVLLNKMLRHVAVDGLKTVVVAYHHIVAIAFCFVSYDADLARECSADGVADIDFDVETFVLTSPTRAEVGGYHTAWCRHAEIAEVAKNYGASVPFLRSAETANDYAILKDVLHEVIGEYQKRGKIFDQVCCILPTAPLISSEDLITGHSILEEKQCVSVVPVVKYSYTIFRSLKIDDGHMVMNCPENYSKFIIEFKFKK